MDTALALIIAVAVFVPCALFGASALRSTPSTPEHSDPAHTDADAGAGGREGEAGSHTKVDVTVIRKVTSLALTSIRNTVAPRGRPELPPGDGRPGPGSAPPGSGPGPDIPRPGRDTDDEWGDPDLEDIGGLLGDHTPPQDITAPRPPIWADTEVIREPAGGTLPEVERLERGALAPGRPLPGTQAGATGGADAHPVAAVQPARPEEPATTGTPVLIDEPQVALEGVDMSQAPIVPASDGSATRLPSIQQMQAALATGGFERLLSWLRAFRKASSTTLAQAEALHADAMAIARRARTKYVLATQAFQAVQSDRLDRATIGRVFAMLEQAHREADAAAAATRHTALLVVAAGGSAPTIASAINTLQRVHGNTAVAIKANPQPVPSIGWYKQ